MLNDRKSIFVILLIGLVLRTSLLVYFWDKPLSIWDENDYQSIARNLVEHHEFSLEVGHPTAMRPPLYPMFLATMYYLFGDNSFNAVRIIQLIISLLIIYIVYLIGYEIFDRRTGLLAALGFSIYPSFLFYSNLILTEVIFTFFLVSFVYVYLLFVERTQVKYLVLAGFCLGLGALTRSILNPFLWVVVLFLLFACKGSFLQKIAWVILLVFSYAIPLSPWIIRNAQVFKKFVAIETMSAQNLYMGNYEHTPLNRAWGTLSLPEEQRWYYGHEKIFSTMNEAEIAEWAVRQANEYIRTHLYLTIKRDLVKAAYFWGLEREIIAGIVKGYWPELQQPCVFRTIAVSMILIYAITAIGMFLCIFYNFDLRKRDLLFFVILIGYFTAVHSVVFGHSRYRLPLVPILLVMAAWSGTYIRLILRSITTKRMMISISLCIILIFIWVREIMNGGRIL